MAETREEKAARLRAKEMADKKRLKASVARRQAHDRRTAKAERAAETRRNVIVGARLRADTSPEARSILAGYVADLTHPQDRQLFAPIAARPSESTLAQDGEVDCAGESGSEIEPDARVGSAHGRERELGSELDPAAGRANAVDDVAAIPPVVGHDGVSAVEALRGPGHVADDTAIVETGDVLVAADICGAAMSEPHRDLESEMADHAGRADLGGVGPLHNIYAADDAGMLDPDETGAQDAHADTGAPRDTTSEWTVPVEQSVGIERAAEPGGTGDGEDADVPTSTFVALVFETPFETRARIESLALGVERAPLDDGRWGAFAETAEQARALTAIGLVPIGPANGVRRKAAGKIKR